MCVFILVATSYSLALTLEGFAQLALSYLLQLKTQLNETLSKLKIDQSERQKLAIDLPKVRNWSKWSRGNQRYSALLLEAQLQPVSHSVFL